RTAELFLSLATQYTSILRGNRDKADLCKWNKLTSIECPDITIAAPVKDDCRMFVKALWLGKETCDAQPVAPVHKTIIIYTISTDHQVYRFNRTIGRRGGGWRYLGRAGHGCRLGIADRQREKIALDTELGRIHPADLPFEIDPHPVSGSS